MVNDFCIVIEMMLYENSSVNMHPCPVSFSMEGKGCTDRRGAVILDRPPSWDSTFYDSILGRTVMSLQTSPDGEQRHCLCLLGQLDLLWGRWDLYTSGWL